MRSRVYLNGRFLTQPRTGVQRFSAEITSAIDRLSADGKWPETIVLTPSTGGSGTASGSPAIYQHLELKEIGRTRGHLWEQTEFLAAARDGIVLNLGNTGPVLGGRRQIVVIHDAGVFDTPESYSLRFRLWYKALQRGLVQTGTHIVTVSEFSRQRIATRLGLDAQRIPVIYEGADHICRVSPDRTLLERHGLHQQKFAVVVGSRVAHKNLSALADAATALQQRGITIALAGGGDRNVFRDTPGVGAGVRPLGRVTDAELRALYEGATCLLFPSRYEGFGLPPVEAMACGCPVLASRGGAVEEICGDGALYFDTDRRQTIIAAIERLLDEKDLAADLRRRGQARVAAMKWEASAQILGTVIQSIQS